MEIGLPLTQTHDLALAAALISRGFRLISINRDSSGRCYFVFSETKKLTEAIAAYWDDDLPVNARTLNTTIRSLKGRIYGER